MLGPLSGRLWAGGSDDPGATLAPYPFAIPDRNLPTLPDHNRNRNRNRNRNPNPNPNPSPSPDQVPPSRCA